MKTKQLIACNSTAEAHIIQGRLDLEGVESFLTNENFADLVMPSYNTMNVSGVQIIVKDTDLLKAQEVIKDLLEPSSEITNCPYCGSSNIELGMGNKTSAKILNFFSYIIAAVFSGNMKPKYYCNSCKRDFA